MHGLIMVELKNYVTKKFNSETWDTLLKNAKLWPRLYVPVGEYPDTEVVSLVTTASEMTGIAPDGILEDFGEFITSGLLRIYRPLVKKEWRTLDLIENTEQSIHTAVRLKNKGAKPPELRCTRISPSEVVVSYSSPRKLCAVAKGIAKGVAKYYGENITISEPSCMHRGSTSCEISIRSNAVREQRPAYQPPVAQPEPAAEPMMAHAREHHPVSRHEPPVRAQVFERPKKKRSWWARLFGLK